MTSGLEMDPTYIYRPESTLGFQNSFVLDLLNIYNEDKNNDRGSEQGHNFSRVCPSCLDVRQIF